MKKPITPRHIEARKQIGKRIAEIRKQRHLTQRALAEKAKIHFTHLASIESGRYSVGIDTLTDLADILGVEVLFGSEDIKVFEG